jgi:microcystin-dependent protein
VGTDGIIIPPGALMPFAGSSAPTGWLFCDGSAVSRTTYSALFTAIGTSYGSGDGSTTFNVPDLRGRVPVGAGTGVGEGSSGTGAPSGTTLTARSLGQWGGEQDHLLTASESGTSQHAHDYGSVYDTDGTNGVLRAGSTAGGPIFNTVNVIHAGASAPSEHNTMPPFVVTNYLIKT